MSDQVVFAVVGHPNKGKSSIVSTLSRNDSIEISPRSGTTSISESYSINILNCSYQLVDTPGFQRPRQVLHWLKTHADNASERPQAVRNFITNSETQRAFPDEVQLLRPILDGAAIIYVVDGSHPYGPEYEAEMEILRWCGQPRLALINPISSEQYIEQWQDALGQYFSVVQTFNPMTAKIQHQVELLQAFSVIAPEWKEKLRTIESALYQEVDSWSRQGAEVLAHLLDDVCNYTLSQKVFEEQQAEQISKLLKPQFEDWIVTRERKAHTELQHIYRHMRSVYNIEQLDLPPELFDIEQWYLWGLDKQQLMTSLAVGGMVAGGAIDLAVGGASMLLGSVIGGVTGLASGWLSAEKAIRFKFKGIPLGGFEATYGPISDFNFPYVVINRFLHLYLQLSSKNHADRTDIEQDIPSWGLTLDSLDEKIRKQLQGWCVRLARQKYIEISELSETLYKLLINSNKATRK